MIINEPVRPRFNLLSLVPVFQWFMNKVIFIITLVCVFSSPKIEIFECGLTFSLVLRQSKNNGMTWKHQNRRLFLLFADYIALQHKTTMHHNYFFTANICNCNDYHCKTLSGKTPAINFTFLGRNESKTFSALIQASSIRRMSCLLIK